MRRISLGAISGLAICAAALTTNDAEAHFRLEAPAVMTEQNDLGDPQKVYPCGGDGAALTGDITAYTAGETITISINETIYHPGHYRVSLAPNDPSELPPDPEVTASPNDQCVMTEIQNPPVFPVIADGMLPHMSPFDGQQSFEVTLPGDVTCDNCTLQVIQYMSSHGAPCFYHHCANISISPAEGTTGEPGTTTGDPSEGTSGGPSETTGAPGETSAGNSETGETPDPTASNGEGSGGTEGAGTGTDSMGQDEGSGGGGGCSTTGHGGTAGLLALLPLLFASRRRRR